LPSVTGYYLDYPRKFRTAANHEAPIQQPCYENEADATTLLHHTWGSTNSKWISIRDINV